MRKNIVEIEVLNGPDYAEEKPYWVFRVCEGENWFFGSFDDLEKAQEIAKNVDGSVAFNKRGANE